MFTKLTLKMRTFYMTLETKDLIEKILGDNFLIRDIAKEEFLKRTFDNLNMTEEIKFNIWLLWKK